MRHCAPDLAMRTNAEQYHNVNVIATTFEYDPANQLHVVTDAKDGKTVSEYDLAGHRTQVTHPASGTTKFYYDAAGNLTGKQTANLLLTRDTIIYKYDYNRLKSINYPKHPENNVSYTYGAAGAESNRAGRLVLQTDGSGAQEFRYGKMGEITEVKRTLVIPNQAVATYTTNWTYDSWNRVQTMTYPDGEMLTYNYNTGGLLSGLSGTKGSDTYTYLSNIGYDKFEQRTYMKYGNGAETNYTYDPLNRRLGNLKVHVGNADIMNNTYTYDNVSNVMGVTNTGVAANVLGGAMVHNYGYDDLYRLSTANGTFTGVNGKTANYTLAMGYDNLHNITSKKQDIQQTGVQFAGTLKAGYNLSYAYANNSQQISNIADTSYRTESTIAKTANPDSYREQNYSYDANGNLLCVITGTKNTDGSLIKNNERKLLWDEENRLLALSDNGFVSNYWYDAAGERTVKESGDGEGVSVNGVLSAGRTGTTNFTAYISPYTVIGNGGQMSKHIYIGSQRIISKLMNGGTMADPTQAPKVASVDYTVKYADLVNKMKVRYDSLGVTYRGTDNRSSFYKQVSSPDRENQQYFFHSDHLGSSSLVTDLSGNVAQHIEYVPFGEVFVEERNNSWSTPYKFNAKELDEETGLYYYGARYYNPRTSVWLSVDPLAEDYPGIGAYVYCLDNPVKLIDPDGRSTKVVGNDNGTYSVVGGNLKDKDTRIFIVDKNDQSKQLGILGRSASMTTFYSDEKDSKGNDLGFMGTINPKDNSGKEFLNTMLHNTPNMGDYMSNASNGERYDFKSTNGTDKQKYSNLIDYYRGMPLGKDKEGLTVYSSGREIGNIVAGFVAGSNGMSWPASRMAFDALQSKTNRKLSMEGIPTQTGEAIGWKLGNSLPPQVKVTNLIRSTPSTLRYAGSVIGNSVKGFFK